MFQLPAIAIAWITVVGASRANFPGFCDFTEDINRTRRTVCQDGRDLESLHDLRVAGFNFAAQLAQREALRGNRADCRELHRSIGRDLRVERLAGEDAAAVADGVRSSSRFLLIVTGTTVIDGSLRN